MALTLYVAICTVEYVVLMFLMFSLFRRKTDAAEITRMLIIGIALESVDFFVKYGGINAGSVAVIVQLALLTACISLFFRVHVFYSAIMGIIGFAAYALIQIALIHLLSALNLYWPDESQQLLNAPTVILQAVTMACALLLAAFLQRKSFGFSFVAHDPHVRIEWSRVNIRVLAVLAVAVFALLFTWYAYWVVNMIWFRIGSIALFFVFFATLAVALRKERDAW